MPKKIQSMRSQEGFDGDFLIIAGFLEAIGSARGEFPALKNHNQYLVATALLSAEIAGIQIDISAIANYTGLHRSSTYKTLFRMEKDGLISFYQVPGESKRRCVAAQKRLLDQQYSFIRHTRELLRIASKQLPE